MPRTHDQWERLVDAVTKKQKLWELFHAHSRTPSSLSDASDYDSKFNSIDKSFDFSIRGSSSTHDQQFKDSNTDFWHALEVKDVLSASAGKLGKGNFGSVYITELANGFTVVVKRLKLASIQEQDFFQHMEVVRNVEHENVVPLRAYYTFKDEKLLIYDHYKASLYALLHGKTGETPAYLDWTVRLKIAVGAARGVSHIHTQNNGRMIHGNIKSSNIFLNSKYYGCISDLGLATMLATTLAPSAFCYAPEVNSTKNVSQASDVYSFGILLLEIVTRKSPIQSNDDCESFDFVKRVVNRRNWSTEVCDRDLLWNPNTRGQIVKMVEIGLSCVVEFPWMRPKMSEIVKMIEDISMMT